MVSTIAVSTIRKVIHYYLRANHPTAVVAETAVLANPEHRKTNTDYWQKTSITRMHSSRMRTTCSSICSQGRVSALRGCLVETPPRADTPRSRHPPGSRHPRKADTPRQTPPEQTAPLLREFLTHLWKYYLAPNFALRAVKIYEDEVDDEEKIYLRIGDNEPDKPPSQSGASQLRNIEQHSAACLDDNRLHMDCWRTTPSTIYQDMGDEKKVYLHIGDNNADSPESGTDSWHQTVVEIYEEVPGIDERLYLRIGEAEVQSPQRSQLHLRTDPASSREAGKWVEQPKSNTGSCYSTDEGLGSDAEVVLPHKEDSLNGTKRNIIVKVSGTDWNDQFIQCVLK